MARKYIIYDGKEFKVTDSLNLDEYKGSDLYIIYIDGDVLAMGRLTLYPASATTRSGPASTQQQPEGETQRLPI